MRGEQPLYVGLPRYQRGAWLSNERPTIQERRRKARGAVGIRNVVNLVRQTSEICLVNERCRVR